MLVGHAVHTCTLMQRFASFPCSPQVVIAVSQVMWCRDLTECLTDEEDVLTAVKDAEQRCFKVQCIGVTM